mgnify:CR=1 FL=1
MKYSILILYLLLLGCIERGTKWKANNEFCKRIDGYSIGSNDLTQLTLGLDRDSELVAGIYDERNDAVGNASQGNDLILLPLRITFELPCIYNKPQLLFNWIE